MAMLDAFLWFNSIVFLIYEKTRVKKLHFMHKNPSKLPIM